MLRLILKEQGKGIAMTEDPKQFFDLGYKLGMTEKHLKAIDRLLLDVLMGDVDPMQAMIDRMKIRDKYHEQS